MISGTVEFGKICAALSLNPDLPFTDGFLAEAGQSFSATEAISFDELLDNNTLNVCSCTT